MSPRAVSARWPSVLRFFQPFFHSNAIFWRKIMVFRKMMNIMGGSIIPGTFSAYNLLAQITKNLRKVEFWDTQKILVRNYLIFIFSVFSWQFLGINLYFSIFNISLSERKPLCPVWSDDEVSSSCLSRKVFSIFLAPGHLNAWIIGDLRGTVHFRRLPQLYRKRDFLPIFNLTSIP